MGVDVPVDCSFQSYQNYSNFKSWCSCSYKGYQKPGRHYASVNYRSWHGSFLEIPKICEHWELTVLSTVAFRSNKIPRTFRTEIPVAFRATLSQEGTRFPSTVRVDNYNCQSYKTSVNLRVNIPYSWDLWIFGAVSKFKQYFQFTLLILKFSFSCSYCELHQGLLKTFGIKLLRTSVAKWRCPLLWNLFW